MSTSPRSDPVSAPGPTFWAGPVLLATGGSAEAIPLLVLWSQSPQEADDSTQTGRTGPPGLPELLERGFARLAEPAVAAVHALPRLDGAEVRLSADGARFQLLDGPDPLVTGELSGVSAQWRDPVRETDLLAVLVATERQPDPVPDTDVDPDTRALERMVAACTAGTLIGAHLPVRVADPEPA